MTVPTAEEFWGSKAEAAPPATSKVPSADDYWGSTPAAPPPKPGLLDRAKDAIKSITAAPPAPAPTGPRRGGTRAEAEPFAATGSDTTPQQVGGVFADAASGIAGSLGEGALEAIGGFAGATPAQEPAPIDEAMDNTTAAIAPADAQFRSLSPAKQAEISRPPERRDAITPMPLGASLATDLRQATDNPVARGAASGIAQLGQTGVGAVRLAADLAGATDVAEFASQTNRSANQFAHGATSDLHGNEKLVADVTGSIMNSAPAMAIGTIGGPALTTLFGQTFFAEYSNGRDAGFSPEESAQRAGIFGAAEAIGERAGFPEQIKLLKSIGKHVPTGQLAKAAGEMLAKEIPGEQLTTLTEFLADKFGPAGLNPNATLADYLDQAGETLKVTIAQSAVMGGGPATAGAAANAYRAADRAPMLTIDSIKAASDAAAQRAGLGPKAATALRDAIANMEPEQASAFVERALNGFERRGMTKKPGAVTEFKAAITEALKPVEAPAAPAAAAAPAAPRFNAADILGNPAPTAPASVVPTEGEADAGNLTQGVSEFESTTDEAANQAASSPIEGSPINRNWTAFSPESGSLGIPRADMPQIKAEHRGALTRFLNARGIEHQEETVDPATLMPTQAEFSPKKVQAATEYDGGDRAVLVSGDGHVIDGTHQWLASREAGQPIRILRFNAPTERLIALAHQFPSSTVAGARNVKPDVAIPAEVAPGAPAERAPDAGGSQPDVGRVAADAGRAEQPAADKPVAAGPAPVPAGAGDQPNGSLSPGQAVTVGDVPYTVKSASPSLITLTDAAGKPRTISKRSDNWGKIKPARAVSQNSGASAVPAQSSAGPRILAKVGTTPATATPLELRANKDGTLTPFHGGHELLDFNSGDPVKLPADTTDVEALAAIKAAGSLGRHAKVFKDRDEPESNPPPAQAQAGQAGAPETGPAQAPGADGEAGVPAARPAGAQAARVSRSRLTTLEDARLKNDASRQALEGAKADIGWTQRGGELIRDPRTAIDPNSPNAHREGDVIGRTPWIGSDLWRNRPDKITEDEAHQAIDRALAGEPMTAKQKRFVQFALDRESERAWVGDESSPELDALDPHVREATDRLLADALAHGLDIDALQEDAAKQTEGQSDRDYLQALQVLIANEALAGDGGSAARPDAGAAGPSSAGRSQDHGPRGPPEEGETRPRLTLAAETEADARAKAKREADSLAAQKKADQEAESKAKADAERGGFTLVGSNRAVDVGAAAGQQDLLASAPPKPTGAATLAARQINAANSFIDSVMEQFGLSRAEAQKALTKLQAEKLVKLDPLSGQFKLKDGRFWDKVVMRRAAGLGDEPLLSRPSQIDSPEFKRWFGDSKVVDKSGEPLVVYHGTSKTQQGDAFTIFDSYASNYGLFGQGSYFTDDPAVASSYTSKGRGDSPSVYPAYLSVKNPIDMDQPVRQRELDAWKKAFPEVDFDSTDYEPKGDRPNGLTNEDFYRIVEEHAIDQEMLKWEAAEMIQDGLRTMGYDGITHIGGGRVKSEGVRHSVFIVFDPEQVKSATGNSGAFNPESANITLKRGGEGHGLDIAEARSTAAQLQALGVRKIHVAATVHDMPPARRDSILAKDKHGRARGAFFPKEDEVWVVASNLRDTNDMVFVVLHEAFHRGLQVTFGAEGGKLLRQIYATNKKVRDLADANMRRFKIGQEEATNEALADLAGKGEAKGIRQWDRLLKMIREWLGKIADALGIHLHFTDDMVESLIAGLTRAGLQDSPSVSTAPVDTALSRPVREEGLPRGVAEITSAGDMTALRGHPDYKAAKGGDMAAAVRLVRDLVGPEQIEQALKDIGPGAIWVAPHAEEASGRNAIPATMAARYAAATDGQVDRGVVQSNKAYHTGANAMERLIARALFDGPVQAGGRYVLVDDVTTMGSTLAEMADHIRAGGGEVVGIATLADMTRADTMSASQKQIAEISRRYGQALRDLIHIDPAALTGSEAGYVIGFRDADELRNRAAAAAQERSARLRSQGIQEDSGPLLSRDTVAADATEAEAVTKGYRATVRRALARVDATVNGLGGLPDTDQFLAQRYRALGKIAAIDKVAGQIRNAFRKAEPDDKKAVYAYLTTKGADEATIADPNVRKMAVDTKAYINSVGDELVNRGLLPEESREEYRDAYLPRMYLAHLLDDANWRAMGAGKKVSNQGYLKSRKDIPQEIRDVLLGEVKDPAFLAATAIARPMRDMALLDWLEQISQHEKWIAPESMTEWNGRKVSAFWLKAEAEALRDRARHYPEPANRTKALEIAEKMEAQAKEALGNVDLHNKDFRQIPDAPKYGRLRGIMVRKEIYDDLMGSQDFIPKDPGWAQKLLGYGGVGTKATQLWKMSKVALNPPGQIRNVISNGVMLQLSGVPLHRFPDLIARALRQIRHGGPHAKVAQKYGVTESTFQAQEMFRARRDLLDLERDVKGMTPMVALKSTAAAITDFAGDAYQAAEALFKTVKIIHAMESQGMTEEQAALEAQKWLFDYSLLDRNLRYLRNAPVGAPFVTFSTKVLPRLAEVALLHPWRFLPWIGLMKGLQMYVQSLFGGDDDEWEQLKKALPKWMQDKGHMAFLPWRDDAGRLQAADLSYFFPWSQWTEMASKVMEADPLGAFKSLGIFGGPITEVISAIKNNEDSFTGRDIVNPDDPPAERAASLTAYVYDLMAPPFLSSNGVVSPLWLLGPEYGGKLAQATTGATNRMGDQKSTMGQAASRLVGFNAYGIDPELTRTQNLLVLRMDMQKTAARLRSKLGNQGLTEEQKKAYIAEYLAEIEKRRKALEDYEKVSEPPAFAKRATTAASAP